MTGRLKQFSINMVGIAGIVGIVVLTVLLALMFAVVVNSLPFVALLFIGNAALHFGFAVPFLGLKKTLMAGVALYAAFAIHKKVTG